MRDGMTAVGDCAQAIMPAILLAAVMSGVVGYCWGRWLS